MFLEKKAEALFLFLETTFQDPEVLHRHMEGFAFDLRLEVSSEVTIPRIQAQLAEILEMKSFARKNMNLELQRWFSFTYSFPTLDKEWTAVHAVLEWMHMQMADWKPEFLKDLDALQNLAKEAAQVVVPGPGPDLAPGPDNVPSNAHPVPGPDHAPAPDEEEMKAKREATLAELRKKTTNTLYLATMVTKDRTVQLHGRIIYAFEELGRRSVAKDLSMQRDQMQTCLWYADRVLDGGQALCMQIAQVTDSIEFLESIQLGCQVRVLDAYCVYEEVELATMTCKLALEYMANTAWTDQVHAMTLPFTLALALHDVEDVAREGLQACKHDWEAILEMESALFSPDELQIGEGPCRVCFGSSS